jgi:putative phosphoribosyl transferase
MDLVVDARHPAQRDEVVLSRRVFRQLDAITIDVIDDCELFVVRSYDDHVRLDLLLIDHDELLSLGRDDATLVPPRGPRNETCTNHGMHTTSSGRAPQSRRAAVSIEKDRVRLEADLVVPPAPRGIVVFAHGSGSSRHSPRNQRVAQLLNDADVPVATLLADLLTPEEERIDARTRELRFDIGLLAERVAMITDWVLSADSDIDLPIGYFGASTGAAAALVAAAARRDVVRAVVSRGGRPDLAGEALGRVRAPTLLIVGGNDQVVLELNQRALSMMRAPCRIDVVPGASHLFEEPGALAHVEALAADWFGRWLTEPPRAG